jgi:hypothetical protein
MLQFLAMENSHNPAEQDADAQPKSKGADYHPTRRDGSGLRATIKALDAVGAVGLGGAGVLWFTSHKFLAVCSLFVSLTAFLWAVFLTKYPSLKRSPKRAQYLGLLWLFLAQFVVSIACWVLIVRLAVQYVRQPNVFEPVASTQSSPSPFPIASQVPASMPSDKEALDVDPEKLFAFFERYNDAQSEDLVKPYIGKWVQWSGRVTQVMNETLFPQKGERELRHGVNVFIDAKRRDNKTTSTQAIFDDPRWIERAKVLKRGEDITVRGQIKSIWSFGFYLEHCEIIE